MFRIGEYVIYGTAGVCEVSDICSSPMRSDDREYYVLKPMHIIGGEATIFTPVDNDKVNMRELLSAEEMEKVISDLPKISLVKVDYEKYRRDAYRDEMSTGDPIGWARIIKTVRHRRLSLAKIKKKITETDAEYEELAKRSFYGEISAVLGIPSDSVEEYIRKRLSEQTV